MQDMLLKISLRLKKSLKKCTFPSLALSTDLTLLKKGLFCQTTIAQGTERRGNCGGGNPPPQFPPVSTDFIGREELN